MLKSIIVAFSCCVIMCVGDNAAGACPANEWYSACTQGECRALNCTQKDKPVICVMMDTKYCIQGCVCKVGYLRDKNGVCVPEDQCSPTQSCPANEEYVPCIQGVCRAMNCSQKGQDVPCPDIPPESCDGGCICKENFSRAANGSCVLTDQCEETPLDCRGRPNEEFDPCPPLCPTDDCSQASPTGECLKQFGNIGIKLECKPKCRCTEGFWKLNGTCVHYGQCPGVCPTNERYSSCIQGECRALNCTQKDKSVLCVRMDLKYCIQGCVCKVGYLRDKNGVCVPEDQCSPTQSCPANEEYVPCIQGVCRAMNCFQKGQDLPCPDIPPESCDGGCICKENFLRAANGSCVPTDQCEETGVCPANERFSGCIQSECRALYCSKKNKPVVCVRMNPKFCIQGCVCKLGYSRDNNGVCIPEDQCSQIQSCPANEEYVPCIQGLCRAVNCSQKGQDVPCPHISLENCDGGCICEDNFLRAANGSCVPTDQCEENKCPGDNEYFACGDACDNVCSTLQTQNKTNCPIKNIVCNDMCYCDDGFARDDKGNCIPIEKCQPSCPGQNEIYTDCKKTCPPETCFSIVAFYDCDPEELCTQGCVCKPGYLRKGDSPCVPSCECPEIENSTECKKTD